MRHVRAFAARSVPRTVFLTRSSFATSSRGGKSWEEIYQKKTPIEHVLLRPDTYVGSIESNPHQRWVLSPASGKMEMTAVRYVPALYKIFDEVLVNACDNFHRPGSGQTRIDVTVDSKDGVISVFNDGRTIPVVMHKAEGVYMPELVFGHLLTGSNFDDSVAKATGGRNGYGAKLANIFSEWFRIHVYDVEHRLQYAQQWSDNMAVVGEAHIEPLDPESTGGGTRVSFCPDLSRFSGGDNAFAEILDVFRTRCFDIAACNPGLTVTFNGETLPSSFESYVQLFDLGALGSVFASFGPKWQVGVGVVEASSNVSSVSFVNSINTLRGGTHVNFIADQLSKRVAAIMKKDPSLPVVLPSFIRAHLVLFVNCQVENPAFDSQTKETLTTKTETIRQTCRIPDDFVDRLVNETPLVEIVTKYAHLREDNRAKVRKGAARLQGIPKLEDANKAGTRDGDKCTLIVTEGDSAKALAVAGLSVVGRDYYGVYPLRGKFLNVRSTALKKVTENKEVAELKRILGLQSGADYSTPESRTALRYGRVMLMTDQDVDGSHIKGLFINFVHVLWPSLIKANGFLMEFVTPLVKAVKGKTALWFFSPSEYRSWAAENDVSKFKVKYYKGLGTSTSAEAREYFSDLERHVKSFQWASKQDDNAIELAFQKGEGTKASDLRKRWLERYDPDVFVDRVASQPFLSYSDFVNKELVAFSYYSNLRSIPNLFDGLKLGQRKVLYSCFRKGLRVGDEIKVVQLAGYISEVAAYHHGETALHSTIVNMAASYVGSSNNVPLLEGIGQFGTRLQGGKDAASARYIFCGIGSLTRALVRPEDDDLLEHEEEDGERVQPRHYLPIVPLILINGQEGVGTGWSTQIPPHHPLEVIDNMLRLIRGESLRPMVPWFRGYRGEIVKEKGKAYVSRGKAELEKRNLLRVTELPVGRWTQDYKEFLDDLLKGDKAKSSGDDPILRNYSEHHTETVVDFRLQLTNAAASQFATPKGKLSILASLNLQSRFGASNMHLWGPDGSIKRYGSAAEIMRDFYPKRLEYYERRKSAMEKTLSRIESELRNKHRFCGMVVDGQLNLFKKTRKQVEDELDELQFDRSPDKGGFAHLTGVSMMDLTSERLADLKSKLEAKTQELEALRGKTAKELWVDDLAHLRQLLERQLEKEEVIAAASEKKRASIKT